LGAPTGLSLRTEAFGQSWQQDPEPEMQNSGTVSPQPKLRQHGVAPGCSSHASPNAMQGTHEPFWHTVAVSGQSSLILQAVVVVVLDVVLVVVVDEELLVELEVLEVVDVVEIEGDVHMPFGAVQEAVSQPKCPPAEQMKSQRP